MTIETTRRGFLKFLGIGAAAAIIEEPVRKLWFVGSNAPVGSRVEPAWTIDAAAQRLYEACGKPFPLPGEYIHPAGEKARGWMYEYEPVAEFVKVYSGDRKLMGRISGADWAEDKASALADIGFRVKMEAHQKARDSYRENMAAHLMEAVRGGAQKPEDARTKGEAFWKQFDEKIEATKREAERGYWDTYALAGNG